MEKEIKINEKAPKAIGPYSPSVKIDNLLFISGQIPIDPINGTIINGNIEEQTKRVLENLKLTLEPYAIGLEKIVKTTMRFIASILLINTRQEVVWKFLVFPKMFK